MRLVLVSSKRSSWAKSFSPCVTLLLIIVLFLFDKEIKLSNVLKCTNWTGSWVHCGYHLTTSIVVPPLLSLPYAHASLGWMPWIFCLVISALVTIYSYNWISLVCLNTMLIGLSLPQVQRHGWRYFRYEHYFSYPNFRPIIWLYKWSNFHTHNIQKKIEYDYQNIQLEYIVVIWVYMTPICP